MMDIKELLRLTVNNKASDLHLIPGVSPTIRVNTRLQALTKYSKLEASVSKELIFSVLSSKQQKKFLKDKEMDLSYSFEDGTRFRVNVYLSKGNVSAAFRVIPSEIKTFEELNLLDIFNRFVNLKQGFVLITGPTGEGKSTTVASILNKINKTRGVHIVTIEDPVEYVLKPEKSIISQREIGGDTKSWEKSLRSCLREDPDVVFIGEMRDLKSIQMVLTIAETGHLVFSTLHTNSAPQSIDRILDVFSGSAKEQVRSQLANVIEAVVSQRLIPSLEDSLVPAFEILLVNHAVKTAIREDKIHMIDNIIQTSVETGMIFMERSLAELVNRGIVSVELAQSFALRPKELNRLLKK